MKHQELIVITGVALSSLLLLFGCRYDAERVPKFALNKTSPVAQVKKIPWLSDGNAIDAYMQYHETKGLWEKDRIIPYLGSVVFLDIDFDGVRELMTVECQGSACCYYSTLYRINPATKVVEKVEYNGSAYLDDWHGTWWDKDTRLVRDKMTGKRCYLSKCSVRSDSRCEYVAYGLRGFKFDGKSFNGEYWSMEKEESTYSPEFQKNINHKISYELSGKKCSRREYEEWNRTFAANYEDEKLVLGIIPEGAVQDLHGESLRTALLKAYRSFNYVGNPYSSGKPQVVKVK